MKKYKCLMCGYVYDPQIGDPDSGVEPGTAFEDLPEDWVCPDCGVGTDEFEAIEEQVLCFSEIPIFSKIKIYHFLKRNSLILIAVEELQDTCI